MKSAALMLQLVMLLAVAQPAFTQSLNDLSEPVSIAGQWRFQVGDELGWAAPEFDDSAWLETPVPAHSPQGHAGYSGWYWYRITLQLDITAPAVAGRIGALGVTLGNVMSAYELYAGGERIGGVGSLGDRPIAIYDKRSTFAIPRSAIAEDGTLVLALRGWRDPGLSERWETGLYWQTPWLGDVGDLRVQSLFRALLPSLPLAALYLVLGLYHLLIARRNPVLKEFFWFGWLCVLLSVYTFETSQAKFLLDLPFWLHKKLEFSSLYLVPVILSQTLFRVTRTRVHWIFKGFAVLFLGLALLLLIPGHNINFHTLRFFQLGVLAWIVCFAGAITWRAYQGSRSARIVFVLLLVLMLAIFNDLVWEIVVIEMLPTVQIVGLFLIIFMALLMAERYTELLKQLEMSVEQRTAELVDANRELAVAVETKSNFLANMSHEMRTPMNAILGLTRLGLKTELDEQQRDYFSKVEQSAEGLQGIIDSILDFSKLQDGQLECESQPFSVSSSIEGVAQLWGESVEQAGLAFTVEFDPAIPEFVEGDGKRLKQVLGIFVSNAVKFTEHGEVRLGATLLETDTDPARIRFYVADTGAGIAEAQREQLFEAFSQADNTMTRQHGGTGIGLSIAQQLVELMGGRIQIESAPGKGSTFSFELSLPLSAPADLKEQASDELDLSPIRGARVLLVDDSALNLQVAGELLRQARLFVDTAQDGREAVAKVNTASYDCVLMDVQMPVMDGYTATEQIRSRPHLKHLPILAMTANAMPQDRARGAEAGMNAYIPKPIDPEALYRSLLQWIEPGERDFDDSSFASPEPPPQDQAELPDSLPGINVAEGLVRVGGNATLYLELLRDLCQDYADAGERLEAMVKAGGEDEARQLAHKLRGIANNLGLNDVGSAAEAIELPIKSGDTVPVEAIPNLVSALTVALESQAMLAPLLANTSEAVDLDQDQRAALLAELLQAVADNNPEALELADTLLAGIGEDAAGAAELAAAREALDMYDFAGAGEHLRALVV